ncbi:MAG: polysaccharide deacetylase family protein [Candidatus Cyclobacteriaceae bacterium M2_1C_046]
MISLCYPAELKNSMSYFHKTPVYIQWLYAGITWRRKKGKKLLYLTFDDGPIPEATTEILNILAEKGVKATFFCVGDNVRKHSDLFLRIIKEGHVVGNHTYNHLNGWKTELQDYIENVTSCKETMEKLNIKSNLFRPPYGKIKRKQIAALKKANYEIVMWDVLSGDFDKDLTAEGCLRKTMKSTSDGSVIVFHDNIKTIEIVREVLPSYIDHFKSKGFSFATL